MNKLHRFHVCKYCKRIIFPWQEFAKASMSFNGRDTPLRAICYKCVEEILANAKKKE